MCEPFHSIVQFSLTNEDQDSNMLRLQMYMGPRLLFGQEINGFYMFSEYGVGHSEALSLYNKNAHFGLPHETKYEGAWWNRSMQIDGGYYGPRGTEADGMDAAMRYSMKVCMGSMAKVRHYVIKSLERTDRSREGEYMDRVKKMLNEKGSEKFAENVEKYLQAPNIMPVQTSSKTISDPYRPQILNNLTSILSQRDLLLPVWADDDQLWEPETPRLGDKGRAALI